MSINTLTTIHTRNGKNWYVDKTIGTNGSGNSWSTAWNSLANIAWTSVSSGDIINVSGGTSGLTYSEVLTIGKSGSNGSPITIRGSSDNSHNGPAIIDRANSAYPCVDTNSQTNIIVENFTLQNTNDNCCYIHGQPSGNIIVQFNTIHTGFGGANTNSRGADIRNNNGTVYFQQNYIDTPANVAAQTDGIFTFNNWANGTSQGVIIQGNTIIIDNIDPSQHDDCIQCQQDGGVTIRNNLLMHPNGGVNNHGIIFNDPVAGTACQIYNNTIIMGQSLGIGLPEAAFFLEVLDAGYTGNVNIYNNTVYGGYTCLQIYETTIHATWNCTNNIFYGQPITQSIYNLNGATKANIDHNIVFSGSNNLIAGIFTSGGPAAVRSTTSYASGLYYFEIQLGFGIGSGNTLLGVGNASASLTNFVGSTGNNSAGWEWNNGHLYINGGWSTAIQIGKAGDILAFACDFTNKKMWINDLTTNSGWNNDVIANQNPATNTGGMSISAITGPYYIMISIGGSNDYVTLNTGASSFFGTMPSGFSAWGATTTLNPSDLGSPLTLNALIALTGTGGTANTWSQWQTLGHDTHGVNRDPMFIANGTNFHLQSTSPARSNGINFISTITTDMDGYSRPSSGSFDCGCYQYGH